MDNTGFFKRHPLWTYLILAFASSWALWSVLVVTTPPGAMQEGISASFIALAALGGFGPSVAGIVATALVDGRAGLRDLFARFRRWRVGVGWYAVALLSTPLVGLATLAVERALGMPTTTLERMIGTLPISLIWPVFAALGEEFGWRGFFLPRLQQRRSALVSSMVVAVAWGLWHLPTQILAFRQYGPLVVLAHLLLDNILALAAMTVVMTWVHNNTRQSMLLMVLFHYAVTATAQITSGVTMSVADGLWHGLLYSALYWLVAIAVIALAGPERLVRGSLSADSA